MIKQDQLAKIHNKGIKIPLILAAAVFIIPIIIPSNYILSTFILVGLYAIVCTGLTLLMGFAGQISLGHAAFYGIGAYSSAFVTVKLSLSPLIGIIIGAIIASIVAVIIGIPTFKLKEHYLALATLGFGVIIFTFFKEWTPITGGLNGFFGIKPFNIFGFSFTTDFSYFYLVWIVVFLGILFARNVTQSRVGRALLSIHGSEPASDAIGINIMKYKLQTFVLSAVYASVAGSLYAHYITFINPQLFDVMTSILFLIMVVIGGVGSVWGGLVGAVVYVTLGEVLKDIVPIFFSGTGGEYEVVFFGLLLVVILIYMPNGLTPALSKLANRIKLRKTRKIQSTSIETSESQERTVGGDH
jgi:branched-chain amino acid transport system permease protein